MLTGLDTAVQLAVSALNNPTTRPVILFIDALNQVGNCFVLFWGWIFCGGVGGGGVCHKNPFQIIKYHSMLHFVTVLC